MFIYTAHGLPIGSREKEAQNTSKDSLYAPNWNSASSVKQFRLNFIADPPSDIKKLDTTGRSRINNASKLMKLSDSQISQIKENYNANLTYSEIKMSEKENYETNPDQKGILGRSKNHNEPTSDIYIWSSNALTEEQWGKIRNNAQEYEEVIKYGHDDVEKYDDTSKKADGRHRIVNTTNVSEEPKYYSFSKAEWNELEKTIHKHLNGEDEKIIKVNEDHSKDIKHSGRNRNEKVEPESIPRWSLLRSYALKSSEWNQLKQNIHHNEIFMNKTIGRGRPKENVSSNGYDKSSSAKDINAVIVKSVTGQRLFDWDRLLENIRSQDSNTTDEGKNDISKVDHSDDNKKTPIAETNIGRSRKLGRQRTIIGIMPSLVLDDDEENIPNFKEIEVQGNNALQLEPNTLRENFIIQQSEGDNFTSTISYDTTTESYIVQQSVQSVENDNSTSTTSYDTSKSTERDIVEQSEQSIELDNSTSTISYDTTTLTERDIIEQSEQSEERDNSTNNISYDTSTSRDNYIVKNVVQSVESDNSTNSTIADHTTDTVEYITESVEYENSTRENYIFQQSFVDYNSTSSIAYDERVGEKYDTAVSVGFENSTRETYVKINTETDPTEIMDSSTFTQNNDSNIHKTTVVNETLTVNALNIDVNIDNTTTEVFMINLSENDLVGSTTEFLITLEGDETTSTNDTIYLIGTDSGKMLSNVSLIDLSEFTTTEDYKGILITDKFSPDTLDNATVSLLENYSSSSKQENISTVSQAYESTTEDNNYGLFNFLGGLFEKSDSKITTMHEIGEIALSESSTIPDIDPITTDGGLLVILDDDGYVMGENRFDIPEEVIMMDEEMIIPITEDFSTTNSEESGVVLLNDASVPTSIENPSSAKDDLPALYIEINEATTNVNHDSNVGSDVNYQSEDPKIDEVNMEVTYMPSSSADVLENMSINFSSEILSTTQNMDPNEPVINSATEKLPNDPPNLPPTDRKPDQPQELVGNELSDISTDGPTKIKLIPDDPISSSFPTWIILLIVLVLSLIIMVVAFVVILKLKRQSGHIQLSP